MTEFLPKEMGARLPQRGTAMEKLMQSICVLLLLLLSFIALAAAAAATSQPTMPRPFLKGSMPAVEVKYDLGTHCNALPDSSKGVIDGNGSLMILMKQELLGVSRDTPSGYPPSPKIDPPYHD